MKCGCHVYLLCFLYQKKSLKWVSFLFNSVWRFTEHIWPTRVNASCSYGSTIDNALANVTNVMNSYAQNRPVSRRQRASHGQDLDHTIGTFQHRKNLELCKHSHTPQFWKGIMSLGAINHFGKYGKETSNIPTKAHSQKFWLQSVRLIIYRHPYASQMPLR